jgi:transketolase
VPTLRGEHTDENLCARGAYVLAEADGARQVTLLATGSEVELAMAAREKLAAGGIAAAVVSMPCFELFDRQDKAYRKSVLGTGTIRVAIEAAASLGWDRYLGEDGEFIGMESFGASAPAPALYEHFGITPDAIIAAVKSRL